jgi:glycerol-3-phosphate dehydrogenase
VQHFYGGLRPLVDDGGSTYNASRRSEVTDHAALGGPEGLISATGGKWTTSRHLAEQVLALVGEKLGRTLAPCITDVTPLPGGAIGNFRAFVAATRRRHPRHDPALLEHLAATTGRACRSCSCTSRPTRCSAARWRTVCPRSARRSSTRCGLSGPSQLEDVVLRRSGLGTLGHPGETALIGAARLMGRELGWDRAERMRQVERVLDHYVTAAA